MAMENGPRLKMYFLLKIRIFQPAMLVYQGSVSLEIAGCLPSFPHAIIIFGSLRPQKVSRFGSFTILKLIVLAVWELLSENVVVVVVVVSKNCA